MTMGPTGDKSLPVDSSDGKCPGGQAFDAGMNMCMPATAQSGSSLMFKANQFAAYSDTSGPRGQSRSTGPGVWMLMFDTALSPGNRFRIDVMGSLEQLIPTGGDQYRWAQSRRPMDMMRQGCSAILFQASQQ